MVSYAYDMETRGLYAQAHQLAVLKEKARETEDWLAAREALLTNDDLGDDIDGNLYSC
jgi:hypothetical protein